MSLTHPLSKARLMVALLLLQGCGQDAGLQVAGSKRSQEQPPAETIPKRLRTALPPSSSSPGDIKDCASSTAAAPRASGLPTSRKRSKQAATGLPQVPLITSNEASSSSIPRTKRLKTMAPPAKLTPAQEEQLSNMALQAIISTGGDRKHTSATAPTLQQIALERCCPGSSFSSKAWPGVERFTLQQYLGGLALANAFPTGNQPVLKQVSALVAKCAAAQTPYNVLAAAAAHIFQAQGVKGLTSWLHRLQPPAAADAWPHCYAQLCCINACQRSEQEDEELEQTLLRVGDKLHQWQERSLAAISEADDPDVATFKKAEAALTHSAELLAALHHLPPSIDAFEVYLDACEDLNDHVRQVAAKALKQLEEASPSVHKEIIDLLKDTTYEDIRAAAIPALICLSTTDETSDKTLAKACSVLRECLQDDNWGIRTAAAAASSQLVGRFPRLSFKLLTLLSEARRNARGSVRQATQKAWSVVMKAIPKLLKEEYKKQYATIHSFFSDDEPISEAYLPVSIQDRKAVRAREQQPGRGAWQQPSPDQDSKRFATQKELAPTELFDSCGTGPQAHTVLLVGAAGMGKTTLCHKLAYAWAQGHWYAAKFEAVYLLPVRHLTSVKYRGGDLRSKHNLETVIAQECFGAQKMDDDAFKALVDYLKHQLEERSERVLLIIDGLDERQDAIEELLKQALQRGKHAYRLLVGRPYGTEAERNKLLRASQPVRHIEHTGFGAPATEQYVQRYFQGEAQQAAGLCNFLQAHPSVHELARVPLHLQLLCKLWKEDGTLQGGSLTRLYQRLADYCYRRYEEDGRSTVTMYHGTKAQKLYTTLGMIALAGVQTGQHLIDGQTIQEQVTAASISLRRASDKLQKLVLNSGFLRATEEGSGCYRHSYFLPSSFRAHFAGKEIARRLVKKLEEGEGSSEDEEMTALLRQSKDEALLVHTAGALYAYRQRTRSLPERVAGLQLLLRMLGSAPQEGVAAERHLLLQLRCISECLGLGMPVETMDQLEGCSLAALRKQLQASASLTLLQSSKWLHPKLVQALASEHKQP